MTAHAYWRLSITAQTSTTLGVEVASLEFRATVGGADQAFGSGGTATASSTFTTFVAGNAFDNDATTFWSANAGMPQWIAFQFPSPVSVAEIAITASATNNAHPKDFDVQYSDNGASWTTLWSERGVTWTLGETKRLSISALQATKALTYAGLGAGNLGSLSSPKAITYVVLGPNAPLTQRIKVRLMSLPQAV